MTRRVRSRTFWPSEQQERLLVVALGDPEQAAAAWRELPAAGFSLDELERGSYALLPLVYRNLATGSPSDPLLPKLKGIYRKTWVVHNVLAARLPTIAKALRELEVEPLHVEGPALAARFYPEPGLRPTSAIDVLVAEPERRAALRRLAKAGWVARTAAGDDVGPRYLFDADGNVCVVRTTLGVDFAPPSEGDAAHAPLWEAATRVEVGEVDLLVPSPTDTLLAVCVTHARAAHEPNVQWVADAKMTMRSEIDWERLLDLGSARGQATRLREALDYLARLPGATPPESALVPLARRHVSRRERFAYACTSGRFRAAGSLPVLLAEHISRTNERSALRVAVTFPAHLRDRWGLGSAWRLPLSAARRAFRLVGNRVRGAA